ncbi:MAG: DNA polymerase IV [Syntrophorhabdus sp.]|nr:DNA polymerase IV [Syntrophorhabdus sp.]
MDRVILHVDMNAYFAAIEERCNPFLKGKPIIVSGDPETRTAVATANYKAREYGVKSGMPLKQALKLCPKAEIVIGNLAKYADTTLRLFDLLKEFTPYVEFYSIDEAFLDITQTRDLFGGEIETAKRIKEKIKEESGLTCSIGIAANKLLAKLASSQQKPDGLVLIKKEAVPALLKDLPVERLWGIGEKTALKLNALGIKTCFDLAAYREEELVRIFGIQGRILHSMGKGEYSAEVLPFYQEPEVKSMGHSYTLFRDTSNPILIKSTLFRLCEQVGRRLRKDGYQGRTITLIVRFSGFKTLIRQETIARHTDDGYIIYQAALSVMKRLNLKESVRLLGVSVSNLVKGRKQLPLFEYEKRRRKVLTATDKINDKFGEFTIVPAFLLMERILARKREPCHGFILRNKV